MEPFTAVYTNEEVVVPTQSDADSLYQNGYGYRKNKVHYLRGVEALYNVERRKIVVVDEETNMTHSFQDLLRKYSKKDKNIWIKFIVYKDLRTRGFIIEIKNEEFHIYERGDYREQPASYLIKIVSEGTPENIQKLLDELDEIKEEKLTMKLAVVDRRGEIVYYGVEEKIF